MARRPRTKARSGFGTRVGMRAISAAETAPYAYVAEVVSVQPPGKTRDTIDATHLESSDGVKEFIGSVIEGGDASFTINFDPEEEDSLEAAFTRDGGASEFQILFPGGLRALEFGGVVTGYEIAEIVIDDKLSATFTVKCSGLARIVTVTPPAGGA